MSQCRCKFSGSVYVASWESLAEHWEGKAEAEERVWRKASEQRRCTVKWWDLCNWLVMAITFAFKKVNVIQVIWSGLKIQLKEQSVVKVFAMSLYTCQVTSHANVSVYPVIIYSHLAFWICSEWGRSAAKMAGRTRTKWAVFNSLFQRGSDIGHGNILL